MKANTSKEEIDSLEKRFHDLYETEDVNSDKMIMISDLLKTAQKLESVNMLSMLRLDEGDVNNRNFKLSFVVRLHEPDKKAKVNIEGYGTTIFEMTNSENGWEYKEGEGITTKTNESNDTLTVYIDASLTNPGTDLFTTSIMNSTQQNYMQWDSFVAGDKRGDYLTGLKYIWK